MRKYQLTRLLCLLLIAGLLDSGAMAATKIFVHDSASPLGRLADDTTTTAICTNGAVDFVYRQANTTQGSATVTDTFAPTASTPPCLTQTANGGEWHHWITPPIGSAFTLSGNIDYSCGCAESATALNAGFRFQVLRWRDDWGGIDTAPHTSADTTECPTTAALRTIAAAAPTSTNFEAGDRIILRTQVRTVGAWGGNSARTFSLLFDGAAGSTGDCFANFVDTITFDADTNNARPVLSHSRFFREILRGRWREAFLGEWAA
jgi:hypothetical protein